MNDIEYAAQVFTDMYEALLFSFFGTSGTTINSDETKVKSLISVYFKTHLNKCPAKALVINAIAEVQSPQPEVKKTVRSYLLRSKLINFEKLDDIYAIAKDQRLNTQFTEQLKNEILDIINPQYLAAIHLYIKYHKVYIKELFEAFCGMIISGDRCSSSNIPILCLATLSAGEEIVAAVRERIYGTNNDYKNSPQGIYKDVYEDYLRVIVVYPSIKAYEPSLDSFKAIIDAVLKEVEDNNQWNPTTLKKNTQGKPYISTVENYIETLKNLIKKKVIINLDTKSGQSKNNEPNLRTIRAKCLTLTQKFRLDVYVDSEKKYQIPTTSCPDFLLDELWDCLIKYGLRKFPQKKQESDNDSLIDTKRILLMGRLYMIMLLCYAFDSKNYNINRQYSIKEIVDHSLKNKQVCVLLKVYNVVTDNEKDKAIIKEIFTKTSKS